MKKYIEVSFVIATYKRNDMLTHCLNSFLIQSESLFNYEVLIVDNFIDNETRLLVERFNKNRSIVQYIPEHSIGRSIARNRGITVAKGSWIVFIDDDAQLYGNYFERLWHTIKKFDFDCFGGMYYPVYFQEKPKWISPEFGKKLLLSQSVTEIEKPQLSLGNFAVKKRVIEDIGGFNPEFGAGGNKIGYGEEGAAQVEMLKRGYKLGFDPELKIDHAVLPHKYKLSWHLRSEFAKGRDNQGYSQHQFHMLLIWFIKSFVGIVFIKIPTGIYRLIFDKDFYFKSFILYVSSPFLYRIGGIYSFLL